MPISRSDGFPGIILEFRRPAQTVVSFADLARSLRDIPVIAKICPGPYPIQTDN